MLSPEEAASVAEALSDIHTIDKAPYNVIERELSGLYAVCTSHFPEEEESDADPPLRVTEASEVLPIDGLLGQYSLQDQRVTIYRKGIAQVAQLLKVKEAHLTYIVRLHEWAHAVFHIGLEDKDRLAVLKDASLWPSLLTANTEAFARIEPAVHENLAQLLTLHAIRSLAKNAQTALGKAALERIEQVFNLLARHQPREYQVGGLLAVPKQRIVQSAKLLRDGDLSGKLAPWRLVLTW